LRRPLNLRGLKEPEILGCKLVFERRYPKLIS